MSGKCFDFQAVTESLTFKITNSCLYFCWVLHTMENINRLLYGKRHYCCVSCNM